MLWNRTLSFPSSPAWQVDLSAASSYPVIANGRVYALINAEEEQLVALDLASGNMVDTFAPGTGGITYDDGKIFVLNFNGVLMSFDAATGAPGWATSLPFQTFFQSPPVAANGMLFAKGSGPLNAVDEDTGEIVWSGGSLNGTSGSAALSDNNVFMAPPCEVDA